MTTDNYNTRLEDLQAAKNSPASDTMTVNPEAPAATAVTHRRNAERSKTVSLEWPVEFDGKLYEDVVVRRMTTAEVAGFVDLLQENGDSARIFRFPMFYHLDGTQLTDDLIDQLDDDDVANLVEVAADFLPRRFATRVVNDTPQETGASTAPTSGG